MVFGQSATICKGVFAFAGMTGVRGLVCQAAFDEYVQQCAERACFHAGCEGAVRVVGLGF